MEEKKQFLVLFAGKSLELDQEMILGCKDCKRKCTTSCVKEKVSEVINDLKKIFFISELQLTIHIPLLAESFEEAEQLIKTSLTKNEVAILVNLEKDRAFIYKGPDIKTVKKSLLPRFFALYSWIYDEPEPGLGTIEDLQILYPKKSSFLN